MQTISNKNKEFESLESLIQHKQKQLANLERKLGVESKEKANLLRSFTALSIHLANVINSGDLTEKFKEEALREKEKIDTIIQENLLSYV